MPFRTLYSDLPHNALYWNPETGEFVEVVDLDSSVGLEGALMAARGYPFLDAEWVRGGGRAMGLDEHPPSGEGPKEWRPGKKAFKTELEAVLAAFERWDEGDTKFENLPPNIQTLVDVAAEAAFSYGGFDGGPDRTAVIVERGLYKGDDLERLEDQWGPVEEARKPAESVVEVLEDWGVEDP